MKRFLGVIGSVATRLLFLVLALAAIIGGTIYIADRLSRTTTIALDELDHRHLPALTNAGSIGTATTGIMLGMMPLLSANSQDALEAAFRRTMDAQAGLSAAADGLPADDAENLRAAIAAAGTEIETLFDARASEFAVTDQRRQRLTDLGIVADSVAARLDTHADAAVAALETGSQAAVDQLQDSFGRLIGTDVQNVTLIYRLQANSNLATGTALALSQTFDPAVKSILTDLRTGAVTAIRNDLPALEQMTGVAIDTAAITAALDVWDRDAAPSRAGGDAWRADLLETRTALDRLVSGALDELLFNLEIESEIALSDGEATINDLIEVHVGNLQTIGDLTQIVASLSASAYRIATAADTAQLDAAQGIIASQAARLAAATENAPADVTEDLQNLLGIADPASGIASTQAQMLAAQAIAVQAADRAAGAVVQIEELSSTLRAGAIDQISQASDALLVQASEGSEMLQVAMFVAAAVTLGSLVLIYVWVLQPMLRLTRTTERLATGDLAEVKVRKRDHSEIGRMRKALSFFRDSLAENQKLQRAAEDERNAQAAQQELIVTSLASGLERLADGDLSTEIDVAFPGEYERLRLNFNDAIDKMRTAITKISTSGTGIRDASTEISLASQDLAQRTEKSATELEQAATALDQLAASIGTSAQRAQEAMQLTNQTGTQTEESVGVVHETVAAMNEISNSAEEVMKINALINDIAFQTNLLALNAGVEAARAGEAGRGFAVVASEVRALAQRSTEAAQEIGQLLTKSASKIELGVDLVNQTETALTTIGTAVSRVKEEVAEIAAGAKNQSTSVGGINDTVRQLDSVTQANAAMFEETTAASMALKEEAAVLAHTVQGFRVTGGAADTPMRPAAEDTSPEDGIAA